MKLRRPESARYARVMNRALLFLACLGLAFFSIACGPPWKVVRQASPNPMSQTSRFFLDAVSFDGLSVGGKSEQEWQAEKDSAQQASWQADKAALASEFSAAFDESREGVARMTTPPGDFTITPHVVWLEPGFNALVASHPTEVKIDVQIVDAKGALVDEFTVDAAIQATISNEALGSRLREAGKYLGKVTAKYMKERIGL